MVEVLRIGKLQKQNLCARSVRQDINRPRWPIPDSKLLTGCDCRAILDLKTQRDNLKKYQKKISHITARETEIAKECLRNNDKSRALLALRRKKYQESLLSKTDQQLAQLEGLVADVEFALIQKDVLFGLQQGSKVMKEIQREMGGLERVELLVREGEEAKAYQEVSATTARLCRAWTMIRY